MDFTLALTHFCEVHGPKSVLCTQVLPLDCTLCAPSSSPSDRERTNSFASYDTQVGHEDRSDRRTAAPCLQRNDTDLTLPPTLSKASTAIESPAVTPNIEQHPLFRRSETSRESSRFPYGRAHGDTCASCSFTVPQDVAAKLPEGAPGSLPKDGGKSKTGAPVLRSREFVCLGKKRRNQAQEEPSSSHESHATSASSFDSVVSHSNCHDHTLTYLTSKSPDDPENYAQLRTSVIRALSCENLPRNMSEGPICFGDSTSGYTIAYVFRLTDPKARGRRRTYAFVALAGKDAHRAFKACPMLWEAFTMMSRTIEQTAQRYQDAEDLKQQKGHDVQLARDIESGLSNISSFLTQRARGTAGQPTRGGQFQPKSLADIVGDENIFPILHQYFVHVLRCLGNKFGGLPLADPRLVYHTTAHDSDDLADDTLPTGPGAPGSESISLPSSHQNPKTNHPRATNTRCDDFGPQADRRGDSTDVLSSGISGTPQLVKRNSQCAPASTKATQQRRVAV